MSRSVRAGKSPGFEYWTRRPGNKYGGTPGADTKRRTHKAERAAGKIAALLGATLALTGCATAPKVEVPKVVKEVVVTYAEIPASLTEECYVAPKRNNTVGEALRVARDRRTCNEKDAADKRSIRKISNTAVGL